MSLSPKLLDVLARDFAEPRPVMVCTKHRHIALAERSIECHLCAYDVREAFKALATANEWLSTWRTDIVNALQESGS